MSSGIRVLILHFLCFCKWLLVVSLIHYLSHWSSLVVLSIYKISSQFLIFSTNLHLSDIFLPFQFFLLPFLLVFLLFLFVSMSLFYSSQIFLKLCLWRSKLILQYFIFCQYNLDFIFHFAYYFLEISNISPIYFLYLSNLTLSLQ